VLESNQRLEDYAWLEAERNQWLGAISVPQNLSNR
jgi:hypothetical protein